MRGRDLRQMSISTRSSSVSVSSGKGKKRWAGVRSSVRTILVSIETLGCNLWTGQQASLIASIRQRLSICLQGAEKGQFDFDVHHDNSDGFYLHLCSRRMRVGEMKFHVPIILTYVVPRRHDIRQVLDSICLFLIRMSLSLLFTHANFDIR